MRSSGEAVERQSPEAASISHRGCNLSYAVRGNGIPVVLIQGVAVHGEGWRAQVDGLADQCRCLSFDSRGVGKSQPVGAPITVEQMADDTCAIMAAQCWESAHVIGHSLGGMVALHLALAHRSRVRSLSLLCTFANGRIATRLTPWMIWVGLRTRVGPKRLRRRAFLELIVPPDELARADRDALAEQLAPIFGYDLAQPPAVVSKQLAALKKYDCTAQLPELAGLTTLVVSAAHDPIAPPSAGKAIAAGIPNARYVEFPHASHAVTVQSPEELNQLLRDHIMSAERAWVR